jgi:predicted enzyme related to lactoylglutathione lyase
VHVTDADAARANAGATPEAPPAPALGSIGWVDLTIPNADEVRDFYAAVAGWQATPLSMGDYDDYVMQAPGATAAAAGVCHARGPNTGIPAVWMIYIVVADLDASLAACRARGGTVVSGPRGAGGTARMAIVRDPAGAHAALYQA